MTEHSPMPSDETPVVSVPSRHTSRPKSPTQLAIQHLRRRRIASVCFLILMAYCLLAAISYLRLPSFTSTDEHGVTTTRKIEFIGDWFEQLATRRLVDAQGVPIDYQPPSLSGARRLDAEGRAERFDAWWEGMGAMQQSPASNIHFLFGTDVQGRSVFWRTLYGARMSLTIAFGASLLTMVIGTVLGAIAGYFGGWMDVIITWLFTTVASIPRILLILAMAYSLRGRTFDLFGLLSEPVAVSGSMLLILAMGLTTWVGLCRLIRGEIMKQRSMDYESAARALGVGRWRILIRHLLPNVFYLVIIQFSLIFPLFIHTEVILSYLGLGPTDGVSWGQMIEASLNEMMRSPKVWWQLAAATVAVLGISLALNLFGDALRDALDPRLQNLSSR